MILSPPALKELFSFYSFLEQMTDYVNGDIRYIYCCKNIKKRKEEFIEYLNDIGYLLPFNDTNFNDISTLTEAQVRKYMNFLLKKPDTPEKYENLCTLLDRLKVIYTQMLKKYPEYFIPNDPYYCYNEDENGNDYICPFVIDNERYCIYLNEKQFDYMDDLKLCFINTDEKVENTINYERFIDKFIKTHDKSLFRYIPYGLFLINRYGFEEIKYKKTELETLFFRYAKSLAKDKFSLKILCYYTFNVDTDYKKEALNILKDNNEYYSQLIKEVEIDIDEKLCVLELLIQREKNE